ncbi:hypothetical protein CERSUDRAFT_77176 [Gelatoporia subvermispora B]|uniref:F-box domain-containing protein n=1 Tax=Ceriporiopsis subvermispora (strain B) TaxID=914234 RepID=M2PB64_CERS8|nr:hypothetical protein CERSUDRAFT_77176 [Gelatoporia subvermispora B]
MPMLPPELTDRIIDFLHDDLGGLHNCSLTCRSWVAAARLHLFHTVKLDTARKYHTFDQILLLSPHLGLYVRNLTLDMSPQPPSPAFISITSRLGAVTTLRLQGWVKHIHQEAFAAIGPVTDLTILGSFSELWDVPALFEAYPRLESLTLWSVLYDCIGGRKARSVKLAPLSNLRRLCMDGGSEFLTYSILLNALPHLESLSFTAYHAFDTSVLCRLLRSLGAGLKELEMQVWYRAQGKDICV